MKDNKDNIEISKKILFELLKSHSKLAQAEYNRNPKYNNSHFSYITEDAMIAELKRIGVLDEFFNYILHNDQTHYNTENNRRIRE